MRVDQRETRTVVIECRVRPEQGLMTRVALLAVATLVVVFAAVTVHAAILEYVFEVRLSVTVIALQSGVRVFEVKTGLGMIESDAAPRGGRMTVLACTAVGAGVHVIDCMAAGTARRRY